MSRLLVLVLALTALVASSCGGGGGNKPLSKSDYEAQIGAILRPLQEKTLRDAILASPADPKRAVSRLKAAETALHDDADELAKMSPPADAADATSEIAQALGKIADRVTAIRKDAEDGNFATLEQFKVQISTDPSVREVRDAIIQLVNLGYDVAGSGP